MGRWWCLPTLFNRVKTVSSLPYANHSFNASRNIDHFFIAELSACMLDNHYWWVYVRIREIISHDNLCANQQQGIHSFLELPCECTIQQLSTLADTKLHTRTPFRLRYQSDRELTQNTAQSTYASCLKFVQKRMLTNREFAHALSQCFGAQWTPANDAHQYNTTNSN